jgi:predicted Fe-S protein YdhL (DUF1289 family)
MNLLRQGCWALALCAAGQWMVFPLFAGAVPVIASPTQLLSASTNTLPTSSREGSPVNLFRQLLAMMPAEREFFLTNRPPEIRKRILAKVDEYEALDPDMRELRLRSTELRWYLTPLLRESPATRAARLVQVPDDIRTLVEDRLNEWTILPPPLQQKFLENERVLHYFTRVDVTGSPPENAGRGPSNDEQARWNALSETQRRQIAGQINKFFELTPVEKQKVLGTLSDVERQQMEKTLQSFDKLPPGQREECVRAFAKFSGLSTADRAEFLKNAQRWSQMSPAERQTWRDLVANVPEWPPLPPGFITPPPQPPLPPGFHPKIMATNSK